MKKSVLGLILVCCMLFTTLIPVSASANVTSIIPGNVCEGGNGVGFYDSEPEATAPGSGSVDGSVALESGEWVKYDVSDLASGTYTLKIKYAATGTYKNYVYLDFLTDGVLTNRTKLDSTEDLETFVENKIYDVYIPEGTETITLRNSSVEITVSAENLKANPTVDIEEISLEFVSEEDTSDIAITSNLAQNVVNKTSGSGYYDASDAAAPDYNNNNVTGNNAVLKTTQLVMTAAGDYGVYDVSEIKAGAYNLILKAGTRVAAKANVYVDGEVEIAAADLNFNFDATNHVSNNIGTVFIAEDSKTLKIENAAGHIYASEFTLEYAGAQKFIGGKTYNVITDYTAVTKNSGATTAQTESGKYVVMYSGETVTVDAAKLSGTYKVSAIWWLNAGQTFTSANLTVNGSNSNMWPVGAAGVGGTVAQTEIGYVTFDGSEKQELTFQPTITGAAIRIQKLILERVENYKPSKSINALNVVSGGQGVGYYDSSVAGTLQTESGTTVILYATEWVKYDIANLKGTYKVSAECSLTNGQTFTSAILTVDGTENIISHGTVADGTMAVRELGTVNLNGSSTQTISLGVNISGGAFRVKTITLEPVVAENGILFTDIADLPIEEIGLNTDIKAVVTLVNNTNRASRAAVIIAVYENGRLVKATPDLKTLSANSTATYTYDVEVSAGQNVKAFSWVLDGNEIELSPLCNLGAIS